MCYDSVARVGSYKMVGCASGILDADYVCEGELPLKRYIEYLKYVFRHKYYVWQECRKLGVPRWVAFWHDWDKFMPDELFGYANYFNNPDGTSRTTNPTDYGDAAFRKSWLTHQRRNWHHWQSWILVMDSGETDVLEMTDLYRREMLADWRGAGKAAGFPDTKGWYLPRREKIKLHPNTRKWIEEQLNV